MRFHYSSTDSKVCWGSRIWLHIDTPLRAIEVIGLKASLLAQNFNLVNDIITPIISAKMNVLIKKQQC